MQILVTGGAGFIGSNFIKYMVAKYPEYDINCYDKLTYAGDRNNLCDVEGWYHNFHFIKGDILKPAGFNAPTLNLARGNIFALDNLNVKWTGANYL